MQSRHKGIRGGIQTLGYAAALFALNAYITLRLFRTAYLGQMGSIEAAYIGLARYAAQHWNDMGWFPLWYGGIPYADTYPPLLHWITALFLGLTGTSPGLACHFVAAVFYCLGPVTLFWLAWRLSGNRACAFAAAVGYSLVSPTCLLVREVRDSGFGYFGPRRLETLVVYGEDPHVASLCLLALALGMLHVALQKCRPIYWIAAAMAVASVPLTNWLGGVALAMGIAAYLFAGLPGERTRIAPWIHVAVIGAYAYTLVAPWLSPSTIATIRANAPRVAGDYTFNNANRLLTIGVLLIFLLAAWGMARWRVARPTRFAVLFLLLTASAALGGYWYKLSLVPQGGRYHLELDMAFWLLAAFAVQPLMARLNRRAAVAVAVAGVVVCIPLVIKARRAGRAMEQPIDIRTTVEYKSAQWLNRNRPGERVFAAGSIGFWLAAFGNSPQIGGGFDNGVTNPLVNHVVFQVLAGDKQQLMLDLMRAMGVELMVAGGKDSAEHFHPISHPEKFAGMAELWRDGADAIYEIPVRSRSLAHVMQPGDLMRGEALAYDSTAMQPYLAALENPAYPPATLLWRAPSSATVTADVRSGQIVSVQMSFDKGWNAFVAARPVPIRKDRLGQMAIEPGCNGPCRIELHYDGGSEGRWARAIQLLAVLAGAIWLIIRAWQHWSSRTGGAGVYVPAGHQNRRDVG